jgi:hypothetical protein
MSIKKLIVTIFACVTTVYAVAGDLIPFTEMDNFKSTRTRADVLADVVNSKSMPIVKKTVSKALPLVSAKTTTDVRNTKDNSTVPDEGRKH